MSGWGYGWRVAVLAWAALSVLMWFVGLILTQFDSQYDDAGIAGRLGAGIFPGLLAVALYSPVTLAVASLIGLGAGLAHRRRRLADSN